MEHLMPKRILVVDDEQALRHVIQLILKMAGYETLTARGGAECLEVLDQQHVDLVLLDLMMPEVDGWEVLRQLKSQGKAGTIPVMLLTAKDQPIDKMLGLKVFGVTDYVTKPFEKNDLLDRVAKALE
jgi:DNA-binding response OmpR family regulator